MKRFLLSSMFVCFLFTNTMLVAPFTTSVVSGFIVASEFGIPTDGQSQTTNSSLKKSLTCDASNLYGSITTAITGKAFVIYFNKNNFTTIAGGTTANHFSVANLYSGVNHNGLSPNYNFITLLISQNS